MDVFQLLAYDEWATEQLLNVVAGLSPEQFTREFAGSLSSVRQQFVHLLSVADRYRARLAQEEVPNVVPESFATPQDLISYQVQMRQQLNAFLGGLKESDLECIHEHATRKGAFRASGSKRSCIWSIMQHTTGDKLPVCSSCRG